VGVKLPRATRLVIAIGGRKYWLWRAVDQEGYILDEIMQTRRNTKAAKRLLTRLLKKQGPAPKRMITYKLSSYVAASRQIMPRIEHRSHKGLNNRAMQGFRSPGGLQRFVSIFSAIRNLFVPSRSKCSAFQNQLHRLNPQAQWKSVTGVLV
jgi:putative transposase